MKGFLFAAALAAVSLFGFAPAAVMAQDDASTMERLDDGSLEDATFEGVTFPETGLPIIKFQRGGKVYACPEKNMRVAKYMDTIKTGTKMLMVPEALDDCPVADTK